MKQGALWAAVALAAGASAQFTEVETAAIRDALSVGNFRIEDLAYARVAHKQPERAPVVERALGDPLAAASELMGLHKSSAGAPLSTVLAKAAAVAREGRAAVELAPIQRTTPPPTSLPPVVAEAVARLVDALRATDAEVRRALSALTAAEQRELVEGLPGYAAEYPALSFEFVRGAPSPPGRLRSLLAKVDVPRILEAGVRLAAEAEAVAKALHQADVPGKQSLVVGGLPVVVAGRGNDVHTERDARLTIDLGGDDHYAGRHGCGIGYSGLLLDMGGNDRYDVPDLSVGAGVLGVGLAYDFGGQDRFAGRTLAYGAALAGLGGFFKHGGHDDYRAVALAQGFALEGVGVLVDTDGDDRYAAKLYAQGAARTRGVGWLVDQKGHDTYRAGGLWLNTPLFADVHYSFAQGFGQGYREDAGGWSGGVGLLTDHAGDDVYVGETYCQAASYWYSVGSLYDAVGNDSYSAHHYAQASAMHATAAYLFDLAGSDLYGVKFGASHAIGHDYGVAVLLDREGDDVYAARDSAPGTGVANGLGLFLDASGDDRYDGPPGFGGPARGYGSFGVFADIAGADKYCEGFADGQAVRRPHVALAVDAAGKPPTPAVLAEPPPVPGSKPDPGEAALARLFAQATQWGVGTAEQEVAAAVRELSEIGQPAFEWMVAHRLEGMDRLQRRCFVSVARALGQPAALVLVQSALRGGPVLQRNAVLVAMDAGLTDVGALLPGLMEGEETRLVAAQAAGVLGVQAAVPGLMRLCLVDDPIVQRAAAASLAQIGSAEASGTAQALLRSPDPWVREAALDLLGKLPAEGAVVARSLSSEGDEARARQGVAIFARLGDPESLRSAAAYLLDPRPGLRIEALRALDGRCPPESERTMLELRNDPVPLVRLVAHSVRAGP